MAAGQRRQTSCCNWVWQVQMETNSPIQMAMHSIQVLWKISLLLLSKRHSLLTAGSGEVKLGVLWGRIKKLWRCCLRSVNLRLGIHNHPFCAYLPADKFGSRLQAGCHPMCCLLSGLKAPVDPIVTFHWNVIHIVSLIRRHPPTNSM